MSDQSMNSINDKTIEIVVRLKPETVDWLDQFKEEWGLRRREDIASMLLEELAKQ